MLACGQLDVAAERRERRGVLPDVERRVDVAAQDDAVVVAAGRPGADRQGQQAGDADQRRAGAQPDELALGAAHRRRAGAAKRRPSQASASTAKTDALQPQRVGAADAEQDHQREQGERRQQRQRRGQPAAAGCAPG